MFAVGALPDWLFLGQAGAAVLLLLLVSIAAVGLRDFGAKRGLAHIPSPRSFPIVGHIPYLLSEPWYKFYEFSQRLGKVYTLSIWNKNFVVVADPELVKEIFVTRRSNFVKDDWSYNFFKDILGRGIVTTPDGEFWKQQRALLSPAFHFMALERLHSVFQRAADRLASALESACAAHRVAVTLARGQEGSLEGHRSDVTFTPLGGACELELSSTFRKVTLEVISEVVLGLKPEQATVFPTLFESVLDELNQRMFHPWRVLYPEARRHRQRLAQLNEIVYTIIQQRRSLRDQASADAAAPGSDAVAAASAATAAVDSEAGGAEIANGVGDGTSLSGKPVFAGGGDMLDMMLDSGVALTDQQLADEVKTQLLAGHETSSMMLTWSCYLLCKHPDKLARAYEEVDRVLGLEPSVTSSSVPSATTKPTPSFEDYKSLEYVGMVFKEAMRLFSPVPVLNRETVAPDVLAGFAVPARTAIIVSIHALHLDPATWGPNATDFEPERFNSENSRGRHPFAYLPFSVGPRNCIGQNLAIMEAKVVLGSLLRKFQLSLAPGQAEPVPDCYVIPVRPQKRLRLVAARRA